MSSIDWKNINLNDQWEKDQPILDPYSTSDLLLEVHCNISDINPETVRKQFYLQLELKMNSAKEVFEANLENIVNYAKNEQ